jgi:hypothetical protein
MGPGVGRSTHSKGAKREVTMKSLLTFLALSTIAFDAMAADSLPGTVRSPVPDHGRTIQTSGNNIQAAINAAVAPATIIVAPGAYTIGTITPKSGVWLKGDGVILNSHQMVFALNQGQKDVWISGFTVNGGPPATPCCQGVIVINGGAADIHIVNNTFKNFNAGMWIWAANRVYVQSNTFQTGIQPISSRMNGGALDTQVISDNVIRDVSRMGIETGHFGTSFTNFHFDRNDIQTRSVLAMSIIGYYDSGTIWGNNLHGNNWGIEVGNGAKQRVKLTVSQNILTDNSWGIGPSHCPGTVIEGNTMTRVNQPFIKDGGYDGTEWVGINTINGKQVKGAFGKTYGMKPQTYQPSAVPGSLPAGAA